MIRIIAGGKKNAGWVLEAISEYEKRLRKPFLVTWEFLEEEKFLKKLEEWPFSSSEFVICCDERGKNITSGEYSSKLSQAFLASRDVVILIGGAYGFSKLVFPHMIARLIVSEQTYRAQEIFNGGKYHHE